MLFVVMISIAYAAAINVTIGGIIFIGGFLVMFIGLWFASPVIRVSGTPGGQSLHVGGANMPFNYISNPHLLDSKDLSSIQRGRTGATAYVSIRGKLPAIAFSITDANDPHELWVFSTRRPEPLLTHIASHDVKSEE